MDEVTFVIRLLTDNWTTAVNAAGISQHQVTPTFIDIRSLEPGKGRRFDADQSAVVVVYEDSATLAHPTIDRAVRNEDYSFTVHLRVLHQKDWSDLTFSRVRLQSLYQTARYILERNGRRPKIHIDKLAHINDNDVLNSTAIEETADLIELTGRTEANDRRKKLLGYKMTVNMKRFGRNV